MSQIKPVIGLNPGTTQLQLLDNQDNETGEDFSYQLNQEKSAIPGLKGLFNRQVIKADREKVEKLDLMFLKQFYE